MDALRVLVEGRAEIKATNADSTPLQMATDNQHHDEVGVEMEV